MGAFLLYPNGFEIPVSRVKYLFAEKGFSSPSEFRLGSHNLLLYSKINVPEIQLFQSGEDALFCTGTFIYRGLPAEESLQQFFKEFSQKEPDPNQVSGSFCLLIYRHGKLQLITDDENLYPVYHHLPTGTVSSSFLALCEMAENLSVHKLSLLENLVTGCSFGHDTCFNEIKRIRWGNSIILPGEISYLHLRKVIEQEINRGKQETQQSQKTLIHQVFQRFIPLVQKYGCELGISGGYDSRLLLSLCLAHFPKEKISAGSNYKNPPDTDLKIAREIAVAAGIKLKEVPVTPSAQMTVELFDQTLHRAFLFYDGQFRVNHGWTREFRTAEYRRKVLGNCGFGVSGHAGELLRNDYNLDSLPFSYNLWINNQIIGKSGSKRTGSKKEVEELISYIRQKLSHIIPPGKKCMTIADAHRYYNEAWVQAGPGIRTSLENQLSFYASPFTDFLISKKAYRLIPFLGNKAKYEKRLIREFHEKIYEVPFEVKNRGVAIPSIYTSLIYRVGLDLHYLSRVLLKRKKKKLKTYLDSLKGRSVLLRKLLEKPKINKHIPVQKYLTECSDESELDRIIAFAYLLNYYYHKTNEPLK